MSGRSDVVVSVREVVKDFRPGLGVRRKRVLDGIGFEVRRGEIFGFVGPNGAGKTTTLKILLGLIHPTSGAAEILGQPVRETAVRRAVGFLPENPYFYDFLTGREILAFYARLCGVTGAPLQRRVGALLERVGLAHAADARLRTYSKGMLQRIGIAQALVHDPEVVFLDEPMSGLDPIGRKEIRDLIVQLHAEGKTVFMNTHILTDVEMLCDRVAIIVKGRIRFEGRSDDFLRGDERSADVTLAGVPPELADAFERQYGAQLSGRGQNVEFRVAEKHVQDLVRAALDAGAELRSLVPHRVSLESIFLSAVEQGAREERGAPAAADAGERGAR
jgi:ABC-2 type transport system ATP-binding protein